MLAQEGLWIVDCGLSHYYSFNVGFRTALLGETLEIEEAACLDALAKGANPPP